MIVKIVKIYLGLSLVLFWAVWGQFIFRQFLNLPYTSQDLWAPSYVVGANYRVLIYCTCHFQDGSLCFSFSCLLVSSVSNFCPDTRGWWWTHFQAQLCYGEGGTLQTNNTGVCSHCLSHTGFAPPPPYPSPAHDCVLSQSTLLRLQVALPGTV